MVVCVQYNQHGVHVGSCMYAGKAYLSMTQESAHAPCWAYAQSQLSCASMTLCLCIHEGHMPDGIIWFTVHHTHVLFGLQMPIFSPLVCISTYCMLLLTSPVHTSVALQFGLVHISAGDLLRAEVAAGTDAGKEAASYMDSGNLVPNSVVVEMVVNRLSQPDVQEHGWLLDGYPRSGDQAEAIVQEGIKPDLFVLISVCPLIILKTFKMLFSSC